MPQPIPPIHRLTGMQIKAFTDALLSAFPIPARFASMLLTRLNKILAVIAMEPQYDIQIMAVIVAARAEGWTDKLLTAARETVPGNPQLLEFAAQFGLAQARNYRFARAARSRQTVID
jgi:Effector-associated domain 1